MEAPPDPQLQEPELLGRVHVGGLFPLVRDELCPTTSLCVLGVGGAVGGQIERRWPIGVGIVVGYDAWFVDSGGVFELGTVQVLRLGARYTFDQRTNFHPSIDLSVGALVLGETLGITTVGGTAEVGAQLEIELTDSVALLFGTELWLFGTSPFTTDRDRIRRSAGAGVNASLQLTVGLLLLGTPGG